MRNTTTITPERRCMFVEDANAILAHEKKNFERRAAAEAILSLNNALESAEGRIEEYSGFISALVAGLRQRWPDATAAMTSEDYTAGDVFVLLDQEIAQLKGHAENTRLKWQDEPKLNEWNRWWDGTCGKVSFVRIDGTLCTGGAVLPWTDLNAKWFPVPTPDDVT